MAELRAAPTFLRATVMEIPDRGPDGGPFHIKVQDKTGQITEIITETPLMVQPGDDVGVAGYVNKDTPDGKIYVPADCAAFRDRLGKLFGSPVKVRSFGVPVSIDQRPSFTAWVLLGMADCGFVRPRPGVTVYQAAETSTNPVIAAAADSIAQLGFKNPVAIVDAGALLPGLFGKRGQKLALTAAVPARLETLVDHVTVAELMNGPQLVTDSPVNSGADGHALIVPFSPLETSAAEFERVTGLPAAGYAPKESVPAKVRQTFNLHASLAMALLDRVGLKYAAGSEGQHAVKAFAESYGAIATLRALGTGADVVAGLGTLSQWTDASALVRGAENFTGHAIRAAVQAVEQNLAPSDAKGATTQAAIDLQLAAELAAAHVLSKNELGELNDKIDLARARTSKIVKPETPAYVVVRLLAAEAQLLATPKSSVPGASALNTTGMRRLNDICAGVENVANCPSVMGDAKLRAQAATALKADVIDTVKAAGGGSDLANAVIAKEIDRLKDGVNVTVVPAGTMAYAHTDVLENYAGNAWQAMIDLRDAAVYAKKGELNTTDPVRKPVSVVRPKI